MQVASDASTMCRTATRFPSDVELHLLRIECAIELMALIEENPSSAPKLTTYVVERLADDVRSIRKALWPEAQS
jgi:hypothetical protein